MSAEREEIPERIRKAALIEAGYQCGVPQCTTKLTLDMHHLVEVHKGGKNVLENLIAVCPSCHAMYHRGYIPRQAFRQWKERLVLLYKGLAPNPEPIDFVVSDRFDMYNDFGSEAWFHIQDDKIRIHDDIYEFNDVILPDDHDNYESSKQRSRALRRRLFISPDRIFVVLLKGSAFSPQFYTDNKKSLQNRRVIIIYSRNKKIPIYTSGGSRLVYSGPVWSSDSNFVAYGFADNWHDEEWFPEPDAETDEALSALPMVAWDETACVVDVRNTTELFMATDDATGYGEWSYPSRFFELEFLYHDRVVFGTSQSEAGLLGFWNLYLDGTEAQYRANNALFETSADDETFETPADQE